VEREREGALNMRENKREEHREEVAGGGRLEKG
jgi:hypothetical protein